MKIAVDIDKTLFDCKSVIYQLINFLAPYKKKAKKLKYDILDINKVTKTGFAVPFGKMSNYKFYNEFLNACYILDKWNKNNHTIILLSSRPNFKAFQRMLVDLVENFKLNVDFIVVACNNKADFCKKYGIDIIIDDSKSNCINCELNGTKSILFKNRVADDKRQVLEKQGFRVASNWIEINFLVHFIKNLRRDYYLVENCFVDEINSEPVLQS